MAMRVLRLVAGSLAIFFLYACGGSPDTALTTTVPSGQADGALVDLSCGLPALDNLPEPERELSLVGPGWYPIPPEATIARGNVIPGPPPDELPLDATTGVAYALYGVFGFDGDNGPTSARITVSGVTGQYYVAFSDYTADSWVYAGPFTGSVTAEIPGTDEYTSPTAFTSPTGTCYLGVLTPLGGALTITGVELGVHGGQLGPRPASGMGIDEGDASIVLRWQHSLDYRDPDFAGYLVQRAPQFSGNFAPLGPPGPNPQNFCLDDTGEPDVAYRYRVAAVDVSGHRSIWRNIIGGRVTGAAVDPVAVLRMPRGPLYGPVDVTFDLSQSFDPENPGVPSPSIDNFGISFIYGPTNYAGAAPTTTVTLHPGCYSIIGAAEVTADARVGTTVETLVVYPRWRLAPVVVREPDASADGSRMFHLRAVRHPVTGRVVLFGYDRAAGNFSVWRENPAGTFDLLAMPAYATYGGWIPIEHIGEPIVFQDSILVPVTHENRFAFARFDGGHAAWDMLGGVTADPEIAAATDGTTSVWVFYARENVGIRQLVMSEITSSAATEHVVIPDLHNALDALDAVYNPATGMIDVVYGWFDGVAVIDYVEYVRWDPVNNAVDGMTAPHLATDYPRSIDVEFNPNTGRVGLVYNSWTDGFNHYRELEADMTTWTADETIDNSNLNGPADFVYAGGDNRPYACFGVGPVLARVCQLYERDGGVWSVRNTASWSADSGYSAALMSIGGSDEFIIADAAGVSDVYVAELHADGTDTVRPWTIFGTDYLPATEGQGFEIQGAGGADGVHVIWRNWVGPQCRHYISPDGGVSWNDAGDIPGLPMSLDLTADLGGEVYCSYVDLIGEHARMDYWDGVTFANRVDIVGNHRHRPYFSALPLTHFIRWSMWENGVGTMHYMAGNEIGGYADTPVVLAQGPVWSGVTQNINDIALGEPVSWVLAGGPDPDDAGLGVFGWESDTMDSLYNPIPAEPYDFLNAPETWGRTLAVSAYIDIAFGLPIEVYWATHSNLYPPVRLEHSLLWGITVEELPFNPQTLYNPSAHEGRRTVSAAMGWGVTAVGLMVDYNGTHPYMEWSHFGDWENLPLPEGPQPMCGPELVVGRDGRWHIIYKDPLTDRVMCRSTL